MNSNGEGSERPSRVETLLGIELRTRGPGKMIGAAERNQHRSTTRNTGVRQGFRNTMDWSKKHNIHDLIITPKGAVVYATREVIDALQSNLTVTATTRPPDAVWEDTTTTPEPVLDDPEQPVNTTPPPRDFFSMGQ